MELTQGTMSRGKNQRTLVAVLGDPEDDTSPK
jgi:hypothetical protein